MSRANLTKSLAYMGVWASTPPDCKIYDVPPTINDSKDVRIGDLWVVKRDISNPVPDELWYLARWTAPQMARWLRLYPQGGGGGGGNLRSEDLNIETPDALGAINVFGGNIHPGGISDPGFQNIFTLRDPADPLNNTLRIMLKQSIWQPNTNNTGTTGMYQLGGLDFMHNYGTHNTALGHGSLNLITLDPIIAADNVALGTNALHHIRQGSGNVACGVNCLQDIDDGTDNIALGFQAGDDFVGNESDNILIGNLGVAGDNHRIRIGMMPTPNPLVPPGAQEQNEIFVAGIWNSPAVPIANTGLVVVDDAGQLYVDDVPPNCALVTDAGGNCRGIKGPVGTVYTGHGLGALDPAPEFLPITSPDLSINIAVDPLTGGITMTAAPAGGGVAQFTTDDANIVFPDPAHNVNVFGGEMISTDGAVANTITINLDRGAIDEVIGGNGAASAAYKQLISSDGTVLFDFVTDPTKIDITAPGGGGGGLTHLIDGGGFNVAPVAGGIQLENGKNIDIFQHGAGIIQVNVTDNVYLLGWLHAELDVQTITGHIKLPNTDGAGVGGQIQFNGQRWISNYGTNNTFLGYRDGNITLDPALALGNSGYGAVVLEALTSGQYNTAGGWLSQCRVTSGSNNTSHGNSSLSNLRTGSYNVAYGYGSGSNYVGAEHSNLLIHNAGVAGESHIIRIGNYGFGDAQQSDCYVAGIYGRAAGPAAQMVICGSDGKLSTNAIPGGGVLLLGADAGGPAAPVGGQINILGGYNAGTRAAANNIYIDVDGSIQQNNTTAAGDGIYALGARGANTYIANRFMHNYGTNSTYLGYQAGPIVAPGGTNCVGIGTNALDALAGGQGCVAIGRNSMTNSTTSNYCTCVGGLSGSALTVAAHGNVLIGYNTGANYDTEQYNIILGGSVGSTGGDSGAPFDDRTMRLGYKTSWTVPAPDPHNPDPVETKTTRGTDYTYIYGIYKETIDVSGTPVYVDKYGKLGTEGGVMFSFHQDVDVVNCTGAGATSYIIGTQGGIVVDFDKTLAITVGGAGAPTVFTAPFSGKYVLHATVTMSIPLLPAPPPQPPAKDPLYVRTSNLSYVFTNYLPPRVATTAQRVSETVTCTVYLDAGDTVQWAIHAADVQGGDVVTLVSKIYNPPGFAGTYYASYFSGYRIN